MLSVPCSSPETISAWHDNSPAGQTEDEGELNRVSLGQAVAILVNGTSEVGRPPDFPVNAVNGSKGPGGLRSAASVTGRVASVLSFGVITGTRPDFAEGGH